MRFPLVAKKAFSPVNFPLISRRLFLTVTPNVFPLAFRAAQEPSLLSMEEIGLQFEAAQENVINAVRRYLSQGAFRPIEEAPLRRGMPLLRVCEPAGQSARPARPETSVRGSWRASHLAAIFESYFDYYLQLENRRALIVGPSVGRWTGLLYGEKAIDCRMLRWLSTALSCRGVGYCFIENEEYSYIEYVAGRVVELFSSFLTDAGGQNFWSVAKSAVPTPGRWIEEGFLKQRHQFIPGFYDLGFARGEKASFSCYHYDSLPELYNETRNYPLSAFRYFYFQSATE